MKSETLSWKNKFFISLFLVWAAFVTYNLPMFHTAKAATFTLTKNKLVLYDCNWHVSNGKIDPNDPIFVWDWVVSATSRFFYVRWANGGAYCPGNEVVAGVGLARVNEKLGLGPAAVCCKIRLE